MGKAVVSHQLSVGSYQQSEKRRKRRTRAVAINRQAGDAVSLGGAA
jgi:hypothetical protein